MAFPRWYYYPRNTAPPEWVGTFVHVVAAVEASISTPAGKTLKSNEVLEKLCPGLQALGFEVEVGRTADQKVMRPVLFGQNGKPQVQQEVDGFHDELGVVLEVEAGQTRDNNSDLRDIIRASLIVDARFLALVVPITYRSGEVYTKSVELLDAIYSSSRLKLPLEGLLLVGY
jgi:hypothetical protein